MTPKQELDDWKGGIQRAAQSGELNVLEIAFCEQYVRNGGNGAQAVRDAGYQCTPENSKTQARDLLQRPRVREHIEAIRDMDIKTVGATKAWSVINRLMDDPAAPAQVQFQAARWTLEASGHGLSAVAASLHLGLQRSKKPLAEMTVEELQEFVERGRRTFESMNQAVKTVVGHHEKVIDAGPSGPS